MINLYTRFKICDKKGLTKFIFIHYLTAVEKEDGPLLQVDPFKGEFLPT